MQQATDTLKPIVTKNLGSAALKAICSTRQNMPFAYLIDAKLGSSEKAPMMDAETAAEAGTTLYTIAIKWKEVVQQLIEADTRQGGPLCEIAQRANAVITKTGILNRHNRRPALYSETTIAAFIQLGVSTLEHAPLIRAAGHVAPPPVFPLNHDLTPVISDIAAYMTRSHEVRNIGQILQSLDSRRDLLDKWQGLDLALFIQRVADIRADDQGTYHPDQHWGRFISARQLVSNTIFRILARDGEPRHTTYLVRETERMVGQFLPPGYDTLGAVRATMSNSDDISWQGPSTFGLRKRENSAEPRHPSSRRSNTGDLVYAFLIQHGPTEVQKLIEHIQETAGTKRRTVQEAINHDPGNRFVRTSDGRVVANPIPQGYNPDAPSLEVTPDEHRHRPAPVLKESELLWVTHYVQALNEIPPPLPLRVTLTGPRATGFALDDLMQITVVVDDGDTSSVEKQLAQADAVASGAVPSAQRQIRILSVEQWDEQQGGETPEVHHNVWLAPDTASRRDGT